jgi:hypothetical protein
MISPRKRLGVEPQSKVNIGLSGNVGCRLEMRYASGMNNLRHLTKCLAAARDDDSIVDSIIQHLDVASLGTRTANKGDAEKYESRVSFHRNEQGRPNSGTRNTWSIELLEL